MPCRFVAPNAIVCNRERRTCATPGCSKQTRKQCDFPVTRNGKAGTCDRYLCSGCAVSVGPNVDHCPPHARAAKGANK
jgi:hypothetical protein